MLKAFIKELLRSSLAGRGKNEWTRGWGAFSITATSFQLTVMISELFFHISNGVCSDVDAVQVSLWVKCKENQNAVIFRSHKPTSQ